jgi:hypothetical protein
MKHCVVEKAVSGVLAEICTTDWRRFFEEFDDDVAVAGHNCYHDGSRTMNELPV